MKRSEQIIDKIVEQLQLGEPLSRICRHKDMPSSTSFNNWTRKDMKLAERVLTARKEGAMAWYDKSIELIENPEPHPFHGRFFKMFVVYGANNEQP